MPRRAMALVTPRLVESQKIKLRTSIGAPGIPTQHTPPPVFCKKSPQAAENKRGRAKKRGKREQESASHLQQRTSGNDLTRRTPRSDIQRARREKLGGNADRCENKGVEQKGVQKMLKTKE